MKNNFIGNTDLTVTDFAFGTAPLGNIFRPIDEITCQAMVDTAWQRGVRFFDTAPMYGHGLSELRTGHYLREYPREDWVLATKVGRLLKPQLRAKINFEPWVDAAANEVIFDYSYDATMRSVEDSLQRMACSYIDMLFIHDIDVFTHGEQQPQRFSEAMNGAAKALMHLKEQGLVKAVGVGVNEWEVCHAALQQYDFDVFLLAGRYTLLEQEALNEFFPLCQQKQASVVVGGGFNSGILATGAVPGAKYNYAPAPEAIMQKVAGIELVCAEYGVELPAAALQFVTAHPVVASFIAGTRNQQQLSNNLDWVSSPIAPEFWVRLKELNLLRQDAPVPA